MVDGAGLAFAPQPTDYLAHPMSPRQWRSITHKKRCLRNNEVLYFRFAQAFSCALGRTFAARRCYLEISITNLDCSLAYWEGSPCVDIHIC
jgi:hypothetical protein